MIVQVHSMFIDVNNLVQMQGEIVTRVEDHVNSKSHTRLFTQLYVQLCFRCSN